MNLDQSIKKIMVTDMVSVFTDTPFEEIKTIFEKNKFHHIPVIDPDGTLRGIISKMDWLKRLKYVATQTSGVTWTRKYYQGLTASEIMTENPVTLEAEDTIGLAADLLIENQYHAIPIVENEKLIGIITSHDLITYAYYQDPVGENH